MLRTQFTKEAIEIDSGDEGEVNLQSTSKRKRGDSQDEEQEEGEGDYSNEDRDHRPGMDSAMNSVQYSTDLTMAFVGCGTLGTAILNGIIHAYEIENACEEMDAHDYTGRYPPNNFIATCRSAASAKRIRDSFSYEIPRNRVDSIEIIQNDNVKACEKADIVLLGCKPYMVPGILGEPGMQKALAGKLLISICAGVTAEALEQSLYGDVSGVDPKNTGRCRMVRVMPNTAAGIRQSMTVIATCNPPLPRDIRELVEFLFGCIGQVVTLPPNLMDASTALCGSGPAFFLLLLEAAIDGGVAMGLPRAEATIMAAQTMKGACMTVLGDEQRAGCHPAVLRDKVTTPGGCTIGGLMVLEEGAVRGTVAKAVRAATVVASRLGEGAQNVNGARV